MERRKSTKLKVREKKSERFYRLQPDYTKKEFKISKTDKKDLYEMLFFLYGMKESKKYLKEVERLLAVHYAHTPEEMREKHNKIRGRELYNEEDVILITYGDLIISCDMSPLSVLMEFCRKYLKNTIKTIHILPFFPYSSDRGFSVTDFEEVDPNLGTWENIENIKTEYNLMFDGVFNHISSQSKWFQEFLNMNPRYKDFFVVFSGNEEIPPDKMKLIMRPRTSALLTEFTTLKGQKKLWTTFSPDQIDLNYKNPELLLRVIDILLFYIRKGADLIRLDAVTYIWEQVGTSCAHLQETHTVIKLFRKILDIIAPDVMLVTETNVPHNENIQYFGNGSNEAHMVYNFALPPLVLHTFLKGSSEKLTLWAQNIEETSHTSTFFNFLDSHDGIGLLPVKNILSKEEINNLCLKTLENGGFLSYKNNGDGTSSPYELNITWYSAINSMDSNETQNVQIQKFLCSRAIALAFTGIPGIYLHSIFGSKNDSQEVLDKRQTRSINRKSLVKETLFKTLDSPDSLTYAITNKFIEIIGIRIREKAFHPNSRQTVPYISDQVFTLLRENRNSKDTILSLFNVCPEKSSISWEHGKKFSKVKRWRNIIDNRIFQTDKSTLKLSIEPYEFLWLKPES